MGGLLAGVAFAMLAGRRARQLANTEATQRVPDFPNRQRPGAS